MVVAKKELDEWLDEVDYSFLNSSKYVPSIFAFEFVTFIKLVNGDTPEPNLTPPMHLAMLDKVVGGADYVANLVFRGAAKTTLFAEYFFLYLGWKGSLPEFGDVSAAIYVSDSMDNGVKSLRKNIEFRYKNSSFLQEHMEATFTDAYIEFKNSAGHLFGLKMFGAKTGLRGSKIFGKRPQLCVLDDLVSDDDSKSKVAMQAIKDTVYKGVNHALDPTRRKVIFNGTPFNKDDILIEAVESGAWDVNVWPVCEKFPCTREEFRGAWPDRFTYDFIKAQYDSAVKLGKVSSFMQELMLRITSEEERLVQEGEINWYPRTALLRNKHNFNFYITTDFATSAKQSADYSVISVWAYNHKGYWFWVDGIIKRQTMDKNIEDLFKFVQMYNPMGVGVEVSGQQGGFIPWLRKEMLDRNLFFKFESSSSSGEPGIRPVADKLSRFNLVVPWFKTGMFHFPEEMKDSTTMSIAMSQLRLATQSGLKGKDDFIDTVSMLAYCKPWKPSPPSDVENQAEVSVDNFLWNKIPEPEYYSSSSYIV